MRKSWSLFGLEGGQVVPSLCRGQGHPPLEGRKGKPRSRGAAVLQRGLRDQPLTWPQYWTPSALDPAWDELGDAL